MGKIKTISLLLCALFVYMQIQQVHDVLNNTIVSSQLYEIEVEGEESIEKKVKQFEVEHLSHFHHWFVSHTLQRAHGFLPHLYLFLFHPIFDIPPEVM